MAIKTTNLKDGDKKVSIMNIVTLTRISMIFAVLFIIFFPIRPALADELSKEEQAYLRSKETITFVSQTRYPPFEFVGPDGDHTGMCIELVRWIATQFGFKAHFTDMPFKEAQQAVLSGKVDVLTSLFFSEKRDKIFDFTKVMFKVPASIFVVAERPDIKEISDLKGKTIAMQAGDYAQEFLEKKNIVFEVVYTRNFAEATDLVIAKKADAIIGDEQIVLYHIFSNHLTEKIKKIGAPLYIGQNCMGTKGPNPTLISILNKGIDLAIKQGVLDRIQKKWVGTHYAAIEPAWFKHIPYLLVVTGLIILLSASVWFWNVQLRQQVALRTEALKNSEEQFRFITEKMADIVWTLDMDFKTTYVSPSIKSVLGFTQEERKRQTIEEMITPESLQRVQMLFLEELAKDDEGTADSERSVTIEVEFYHKDGSTVWSENRVKWIRDPSGSMIGFHGVSRDITERKRVEADRERLLSAIEQAAETIVITDAEGNIQYTNPAFERITGYSREEVVGENPRILKSGEHDKSFYRQMWQTITAGDTWRGSIINRKKDGTFYTTEASISPVLDGAGGVVNFVAVKRDITDEIRMKEKLRQAQKMESIGTLAGGIAHDFNNILFPMVGYAEMLKLDLPADSPLHGHVDEILNAALRSKDLVKQILAFSRQSDQDIKPIKLQPIVKEATKLLRSSIPTIIDIKQDIDPDCGVVVADPTQVHQIVMNLATNAYHAMEKTGGRLNVNLKQVRLESDQVVFPELTPGEYAILTVTDTGVGIEKDIMDKILDPYFTTKETGKGTGLGLSVVQGIVKSCNGDIRIYSEAGKGTEIQVYLPIMDRKVDDIRTDRNEQPIRGGTEKILLVDDEEAIIRMEQQMLERLGYIVTIRTGSVDALEAFKANPDSFDLVLTDMTMPNMTGVRLAGELKKTRPDIPVILCTGFSYQINDEKSKALGIQGFVMKPVVMRELAETIRKVLDNSEEG